VEVLGGGNVRRRMEIRSWKENLKGTMFLARHDRKKLRTIL
jgi:hypothetical protein